MTRTALWIVGEPGIGKTTLVRELLKGRALVERVARPKHEVYDMGAMFVAGHYTGSKFDGADTLPISDIRPLIQLWSQRYVSCMLSVFDGDKLSSGPAFKALSSSGVRCCVIYLHGEELAQDRRTSRGTTQNAAWVAGRRQKSKNFIELFPRLDTLRISAADNVHAVTSGIVNEFLQDKAGD